MATDGIVLSPDVWDRVRRMLLDYERRGPAAGPQPRRGPAGERDSKWFTYRNDSGEAIPAYACLQLTGNAFDDSGRVILTVAKPNADSIAGCPLNGHRSVAIGGFGRCTFEPWRALYNAASTPAFGESWGSEANQWPIKKGNTGFQILGAHTTGSGARVSVRPESAGSVEPIRFELTSALIAGGTANAKRVIWNGLAYVTTDEPTITVRDFTTPGTWQGAIGYQGWCLSKTDRAEIVTGQGNFEIIWMESDVFGTNTTPGATSVGPYTTDSTWMRIRGSGSGGANAVSYRRLMDYGSEFRLRVKQNGVYLMLFNCTALAVATAPSGKIKYLDCEWRITNNTGIFIAHALHSLPYDDAGTTLWQGISLHGVLSLTTDMYIEAQVKAVLSSGQEVTVYEPQLSAQLIARTIDS